MKVYLEATSKPITESPYETMIAILSIYTLSTKTIDM